MLPVSSRWHAIHLKPANTLLGLQIIWVLLGMAAAACMRQGRLMTGPGLAGEALPALCRGPPQLPRAAAGGGQRHSRCVHYRACLQVLAAGGVAFVGISRQELPVEISSPSSHAFVLVILG